MRTLPTSRPARWTGIGLILIVGVLGLHLTHYLTETRSPAGYAAYPGLILVFVMIAAVIAAIGIAHNHRYGWWLGIGVATASVVLYAIQEAVGLPGLSQTWWEPTRLLSLLLAGLFVVLAYRHNPRRQ